MQSKLSHKIPSNMAEQTPTFKYGFVMVKFGCIWLDYGLPKTKLMQHVIGKQEKSTRLSLNMNETEISQCEMFITKTKFYSIQGDLIITKTQTLYVKGSQIPNRNKKPTRDS